MRTGAGLGRSDRRRYENECYSTGVVDGNSNVGGLVGYKDYGGVVTQCYSMGAVSGKSGANGLAGYCNWSIMESFWDTQTSGQATSAGDTGKTTAEIQTASTFLNVDWDFVDQTENGTDDIWWILEGQGYPRLWWELIPEN
jgi:hypothetical protein